MDPYKYYTKEQYEKYGSMLETAQEIDARIKTHKFENNNLKKCRNHIKTHGRNALSKQNNSKNIGIILQKMVPFYVTSLNF